MVTSLRLLLPGLLLLACSSREPAISVAIDDRPRPGTSDDAWMDFDAGPPSDATFNRDVGGRFDRAGDVPTFDAGPLEEAPAAPPVTCPRSANCPAGATLTGRVLAPNGLDPIAGAVVYLSDGPVAPFAATPTCDLCERADLGCASARSLSDGSFALGGLPTGRHQVVIQKGRFRRRLSLDLACGANALDAPRSRLPRSAAEGDVPRIAVSNGDYDQLECVLAKVGLDPAAIDLYNHRSEPELDEPGRPSIAALLGDAARLRGYHMLFINCTDAPDPYAMTPRARDNLRDWVAAGGRLFVTDHAYDFIEQVAQWSPAVCWEGATTCGASPEARDGAELGLSVDVDATITDPGLHRWLGRLGALNADGTAPLRALAGGWAVQRSLGAGVRAWASGAVTFGTDEEELSGVRPLTFSFDDNRCGRVVFSSYHTNDILSSECDEGCRFPMYCGDDPFTPHERILEYLLFEASGCIDAPP